MDWDLLITRIENGFLLTFTSDMNEDFIVEKAVVEREWKDCDHDENVQQALLARDLLWEIVEYFSLDGSKYDQRRVKVCLEKGSKFEGKDTYKDEWGQLFRYDLEEDE